MVNRKPLHNTFFIKNPYNSVTYMYVRIKIIIRSISQATPGEMLNLCPLEFSSILHITHRLIVLPMSGNKKSLEFECLYFEVDLSSYA